MVDIVYSHLSCLVWLELKFVSPLGEDLLGRCEYSNRTQVRTKQPHRDPAEEVVSVHFQTNSGTVRLRQRSQTQFLEGHSSAEFSFNQLQLTAAWKFLVILKRLISWIRCVWLGLELNCAELWPSRNWVWDQWFKAWIWSDLDPTQLQKSRSETDKLAHVVLFFAFQSLVFKPQCWVFVTMAHTNVTWAR